MKPGPTFLRSLSSSAGAVDGVLEALNASVDSACTLSSPAVCVSISLGVVACMGKAVSEDFWSGKTEP